MCDIKWRFPGNGYTADSGLDTADMETFKKDAISSLARELCQNSIDARRENAIGPVKIVFNSFKINANLIPGKDQLISQIEACQRTWKTHKKISKQLEEMHNQITMDEIVCLRISDFNTTGLIGVSGEDKTPWHYLVHGSGISDKGDTSGGSKGIGKFATFVTSHFNTVFYSTRTIKNEYGYEGICKLCSAEQPNTNEKTQGIGYFGITHQNKPIIEDFNLDPTFVRNSNEYGSDIFILGFKNSTGWRRDIISKILDSFMSAIVFDSLEVEIDGIIINKKTLKDVVYNGELINKNIKKSAISQYLLLTDKEHRYEDVITIEGYGTAKLYLIEFTEDKEELATNNCVMIRYPYMKIKDLPRISTLPCSAMCIIENNDLNKTLRNVENPQHTNWEFNRIEDESEKQEVKAIYNELIENIKRIITDHLASSDNTETDIEGAGDYFESTENETVGNSFKRQKIKDKAEIKKKIRPKKSNVNASVEDVEGDGISLDIGTDDPKEEILTPNEFNAGGGGTIIPGSKLNSGTPNDDGHVLVKPAELRGMSYRFFCISKKDRKYVISFISDFTEEDVSLELYALDESGNKYPVKIEKCLLEKEELIIKNETEIKFSIKKGQRIKLEMITDQRELFSGEVKVYAFR